MENRPKANFVSSIWGDVFLNCPDKCINTSELEHEELKQQVRRMLITSMDEDGPSQKLLLIDAIQRLGVAYHFEKEIEDVVQNIYDEYGSNEGENDDLYNTAVRFRLLREHGFDVHCETFRKFKDEQGEFKESLISDVRGLLELYEAAHLGFHGEDILEEAIAFTTSHLELAQTKALYVGFSMPLV